MFQGFSSSSFFWDETRQNFRAKTGIYVTHLSHKSLHDLFSQFTYGATCLKLVEIVIGTVETSMRITSPTLRAFSFSASEWLKVCSLTINLYNFFLLSSCKHLTDFSLEQRLRSIALKEEMKICEPNVGISTTLLGLANSLSRLVYDIFKNFNFQIGDMFDGCILHIVVEQLSLISLQLSV